MTPLFSKGSLIVLESLSFTKTLYAFDFDGTLSKIVAKPDDATISAKTESLLKRLSEKVPVAIISGRSLEDLRKRIHFNPKFLIGNHGLEGLTVDSKSLDQAKRISARWMSSLRKEQWLTGIEIEDKDFSLAIHYRRSRNKKEAREQILAAIARLEVSPRIIQGKLVYNLIPEGAPHKGAAILDLLKKSGMRHAFYIGDDDTDEDVFGLPYEAGQVMTVRVGKKSASRARYFLERQSEINRLLELLLSFHKTSNGSGKHLGGRHVVKQL